MSLAAYDRCEPWTFDHLEHLPDDGRGSRFEVVDGSLVMTPVSTDFHQAVARRLFRQLDGSVPPEWEVLYDGVYAEAVRLESGAGDLPGPWTAYIDVGALTT